jgi:hypothetical protein
MSDGLPGDDREPAFDLVDPTGPDRVKWKCTCGLLASQVLTSGVVWVHRLSSTVHLLAAVRTDGLLQKGRTPPPALVRGQRRRWLRIPASWPWADSITAAFTRIGTDPGQ